MLEPRSRVEYEQAIRDAIDAADEILRTFNALLVIARVEAKVGPDEFDTLDLGELVSDFGDLYEEATTERGLELVVETEPRVLVNGDRQLLAQALSNLLENAIKYAGAGSRVTISARKRGGSGELMVVDTGMGIPADKRERVLERLVRLDHARPSPGNGLGLSLVKAVADYHGGALRLEDHRPGLRVRMSIPVRRIQLPTARAPSSCSASERWQSDTAH